MEYVHLGRTGLSVSRICLGTMNFGPVTSKDDSFAIMDAAHAHGVNFFDSANVYGWSDKGLTERIVGEWFAQGGGRRERTVLATKLYGDMGDWPNDGKLSALNIRRACDASLARLVGIPQCHEFISKVWSEQRDRVKQRTCMVPPMIDRDPDTQAELGVVLEQRVRPSGTNAVDRL